MWQNGASTKKRSSCQSPAQGAAQGALRRSAACGAEPWQRPAKAKSESVAWYRVYRVTAVESYWVGDGCYC